METWKKFRWKKLSPSRYELSSLDPLLPGWVAEVNQDWETGMATAVLKFKDIVTYRSDPFRNLDYAKSKVKQMAELHGALRKSI